MEAINSRRTERFLDALRRLVRRGARKRISRLLEKLRPEDVSLLLSHLTPAEQIHVFQVLWQEFPDTASDVLTAMESPDRVGILKRLTPEEIAGVLERAPVDDAVLLVDELPDDHREEVLKLVDLRKELDDLQSHLGYRDDSAGRIMDDQFLALPETTTVEQAVAAIREQPDVEMIFYLYVVDDRGHLVGVTSLRQLLISPPSRKLGEIMQQDVIQVHTETDQEEVAELAARYDLLAIPVTDHRNRLRGIVTVDDIVDVVREEATEDFYKMVGTSDDELLHGERPLRVSRIRLPWLLVNLVGLICTGLLLEYFQERYQQALFLLAFVPAIMGMGGNSGSQTSTITVRSLATGRLRLGAAGLRTYIWRQTQIGGLLGLAMGVLVALAAQLLEGNPTFAAVVGGSLFLAILMASLIGAVIPVLFERLGIDPAVAAGPLVTTSSDVLGILIYFGLVALSISYLLP